MATQVLKFLLSAFEPSHFPEDEGEEIIFCGRSNVGKSTMLNMVLGRLGAPNIPKERPRVSSRPGSTEGLNFYEARTNKTRWALVDAPGYGYKSSTLDMKKEVNDTVAEYIQHRESLKEVFVLIDVRRGIGEIDNSFIRFLEKSQRRFTIILTKCDKLKDAEVYSMQVNVIEFLKFHRFFSGEIYKIGIKGNNDNERLVKAVEIMTRCVKG